MFSVHEHLKKKRVPIDKWSIKERLCLASAVARSGDQNWTSVSRSLKPFHDPSRPADWFSQKNCAAQYGLLLETVDTPKRKKRVSGVGADAVGETDTPLDLIRKNLTDERIKELQQSLEKTKKVYQQIVPDLKAVRAGTASEEKIRAMYNEVLERRRQKEIKNVSHKQWLKEREEKKMEMERLWRPTAKPTPVPINITTRRKDSDSMEVDDQSPQEMKPSTSPLLTSLLKSPSPAPNPSLLHSAMTNRVTSPAVVNSLNTPISQLASIQQPEMMQPSASSTAPTLSMLLEKPSVKHVLQMPTIPVAMKKNEEAIAAVQSHVDLLVAAAVPIDIKTEVDDIASEIPEDILNLAMSPFVAENMMIPPVPLPPHRGGFIDDDDMSLDEKLAEVDNIIKKVVEKEKQLELARHENAVAECKAELLDTETDSNSKVSAQIIMPIEPRDNLLYSNEIQAIKEETADSIQINNSMNIDKDFMFNHLKSTLSKNEPNTATKVNQHPQKVATPGPVEVVEVVVMEDDDSDKESKLVSEHTRNLEMSQMVSDLRKECGLDKSEEELVKDEKESQEAEQQISDIIKSLSETGDSTSQESTESQKSAITPEPEPMATIPEVKDEPIETPLEIKTDSEPKIVLEKLDTEDIQNVKLDDVKVETVANEEATEPSQITETLDTDDDTPIEVIKEDKPGKTKRDYSRKKVEDKPKTEDDETVDIAPKKLDFNRLKMKPDERRSESPWGEEEETPSSRSRRRYSQSIDSVPNSPASSASVAEDEKEYKAWKKSIVLVFNRLSAHRSSSLFNKPITNEQAPGYHKLVKRPMDLSTIRKNLENGNIRTTLEFQRDVMLMFTNALMYNKPDSTVYQLAKETQQEALQQIQILLQAQTQVETPVRRETRTSEPGLKRKRGQDK